MIKDDVSNDIILIFTGDTSNISERSGDRIPVGARFSAPVQTGPEVHTTSHTKGTGSFPGVSSAGE